MLDQYEPFGIRVREESPRGFQQEPDVALVGIRWQADHHAAPGLCAFIATAKYQDGLPLYRQETILARHGLTVSRATLASWMIRLGELIMPLINLAEDIGETTDLAAKHPEKVTELTSLWQKWNAEMAPAAWPHHSLQKPKK